jgi:hypothetical protein
MEYSRSTALENDYVKARNKHLEKVASQRGLSHLTENFSKFTSRQTLTRFLAHDEIFRKILDVHGSVIECGVYLGQSLMTWAQLSSIYEPIGGATREIFGFDTFTGFPAVTEFDLTTSVPNHEIGDLDTSRGVGQPIYNDLIDEISIFDKNRFLPQFQKVSLIKGDFTETCGKFLQENAHVIPALLYLDFDLYEPTAFAIKNFLPRMSKGSIVAFDELNDRNWPGEAKAMLETLNINNYKLKKVGFDIKISYIEI